MIYIVPLWLLWVGTIITQKITHSPQSPRNPEEAVLGHQLGPLSSSQLHSSQWRIDPQPASFYNPKKFLCWTTTWRNKNSFKTQRTTDADNDTTKPFQLSTTLQPQLSNIILSTQTRTHKVPSAVSKGVARNFIKGGKNMKQFSMNVACRHKN